MGQRFLAVVVVIASACTALHYSVTEQKSVTISNVTNPYYFTQGGTQKFTLSPVDPDDDDTIQSITDFGSCSSQWSIDTTIDSQGMPPGPEVCGLGAPMAISDPNIGFCPRNYDFNVTFAGTQPGSSSCNVYITYAPVGGSGSAISQYILSLNGSGTAGSGITVTPPSIDFGDQQFGTTTAPAQVTVKNNSNMFIAVSGQLMGAAFSVTPGISSFGLGSGSSKVFNITCNPPAINMYAGYVLFTSGNTGTTTFMCNGIDSQVVIAPSQVTFAPTLVGRQPPMRTVNINGNLNAVIESVTLDATAIGNGVTIVGQNPEGMTVGNGKMVVLDYSAAAMHPAGSLGSLAIKVSVDMTPRNIAINGEALVGGVGTNPASVEFGAVCAGEMAMKDVEVYASEPGNVMLNDLVKPASPFDAMAVDTLPRQLAGNHSGPSVTVHATYKPSAPGDYKDQFRLTSDVPSKPDLDIDLHGLALAEGISATPDAVHFGTVAVGTTTGIKQVQFTNCGKTDLMFNGVSLTGVNHAEFTLVDAYPPKVLHPTESLVFMILMQPDTSGLKTGALVINHDAGSTTVELDGTGEGGSNKDRETYYACSTGRGAGAWPVLLALLALVTLRRRCRSRS